MTINLELTESCKGFWKCLDTSDWIQLISVIIAMIAAIASYVTVLQQKKHYKEIINERKIRYRPNFKINNCKKRQDNILQIDLVNDGFHFFIPKEVKWKGKYKVNCDFKKGYVQRKINGEIIDEKELLALIIELPDNVDEKGKLILIGFDIENNLIQFETPEVIIDNGNIKNTSKLMKQYLVCVN